MPLIVAAIAAALSFYVTFGSIRWTLQRFGLDVNNPIDQIDPRKRDWGPWILGGGILAALLLTR